MKTYIVEFTYFDEQSGRDLEVTSHICHELEYQGAEYADCNRESFTVEDLDVLVPVEEGDTEEMMMGFALEVEDKIYDYVNDNARALIEEHNRGF